MIVHTNTCKYQRAFWGVDASIPPKFHNTIKCVHGPRAKRVKMCECKDCPRFDEDQYDDGK